MPRDREAKQTVDKKPRVPFKMLVAAGASPEERAAAEKLRAKKEELQKRASEGNPFEARNAKKELNKLAKKERDQQSKQSRRETADQFGLGRVSEYEPKGKNKEKMQKENADQLLQRINATARGAARGELRAIRKSIKEGPVVRLDDVTGKEIRDPSKAGQYFGADTKKILDALDSKIGKSYSGKKENTGTFTERPDAPNVIRYTGRRGRDYVKARSDVDVTKSKRSKFSQVKKNPVGRPKGSKNKPKNPPQA